MLYFFLLFEELCVVEVIIYIIPGIGTMFFHNRFCDINFYVCVCVITCVFVYNNVFVHD